MVFRRRARRMAASYPKTFKKVLNFAPAGRASSVKIDFLMVQGTDGASPGQTGPVDALVPTGSIVEFIDIYYCAANLAAVALFHTVSIQNLIANQAATLDPRVVGGATQRNQVHHQEIRSIGENQNATFHYRFKVPKSLRRVKDDSKWLLTVIGNNAWTDVCQVIYKIKT